MNPKPVKDLFLVALIILLFALPCLAEARVYTEWTLEHDRDEFEERDALIYAAKTRNSLLMLGCSLEGNEKGNFIVLGVGRVGTYLGLTGSPLDVRIKWDNKKPINSQNWTAGEGGDAARKILIGHLGVTGFFTDLAMHDYLTIRITRYDGKSIDMKFETPYGSDVGASFMKQCGFGK